MRTERIDHRENPVRLGYSDLRGHLSVALRETLNTIRSGSVPPNEEAAKFQIIAPILSDLGWNPFGSNVLYEHSVGGGGGGSVDIALQGPRGDLVALIEAKRPGIDLSRHVSQVLGYAFHEGVDICVLTTGLEWWLYLPREAGSPDQRRFTILRITADPTEQLVDDLETFLGFENLVGGEAAKKAKQVLKASEQAALLGTEIPQVWQSMLNDSDDDLIELVRQRVYEKVNLRPEPARVAQFLRGESSIHRASTTVTPAPSPITTHPPTKNLRPTGFRLWGNHYIVKSGAEMYAQTAGLLYQRYGQEFINRLLTLHTPRGKAYAYRYDPNKKTIQRSKKISDTDVFLDTNLRIEQSEERAHEFLKLFGHPPSDLEILYD